MALDYNAINLSQGFPDFNCPEELLNLLSYYQSKGYNQYAPMQGVPALRQKISRKIEKLYGKHYDPSKEIIITAGATQAIYTAITASIFESDEVILFEPAYDSYAPSVIINGGKPIFIPLRSNTYSIDWDLVEKAVNKKTKMIIINSPHNPTGSVISLADLKCLEEVVKDTGILILSDEVYEHIIFDGMEHISLASSEEISKRAFIISSFGKTYHTTGWKMGYCAAPEFLINEFRKIHQFIVFAVNTPIQYAYADFMDNEEHYLSLNKFYQDKRDLFLKQLDNSKFKFKPSKGTYFQLLDYSNISDMNDLEFTEYLTKEVGVAAIPLSPFYSSESSNGIIRLCFAKRDEVLTNAAEKLCKI